MKDNIVKRLIKTIIQTIPKKQLILFESISDFCDSSKTLFDCCIENKLNEKYKIIWYVDDLKKFKKLEKSYKNVKFRTASEKGINYIRKYWEFIRAKYCFYTHRRLGINGDKKQVRFFLTHASVPIKNSKGCFWDYQFNTDILSTSEFASNYRCQTFNGGEELVRILGLPRNDLLLSKQEEVKSKLYLESYKKIIMWLPTFKHYKNSDRNDYESSMNKDISMLDEDFLTSINGKLANQNIMLIVKFHPGQDLKYISKINMSNIKSLTNNDLLEKEIDLYSLLGVSDALITDFSSVYFDYLLTDKPIAFELKDKHTYEKGRGFLMDNPLDFMPGHKIYNEKEFNEFIDDIIEENDKFRDERRKLRDLVHTYQDNKSADRILKFLKLI